MKRINIFALSLLLLMTFTVTKAQPPMDIQFIGSYTAQEKFDINMQISADPRWAILGWTQDYSEKYPPSDCDINPNTGCPPEDPLCSGCNWSGIPWTKVKVVIKGVQNYEDCDITVVYEYRICPTDFTMTQVNIISFTTDWWFTGWLTRCDDLKAYMQGGTPLQKALKQDWLSNQLYYLISKDIFNIQNQHHRDNTNPPQNILCDENGDPTAPLSFKVFYSKATCSSKLWVTGHQHLINGTLYPFSMTLNISCTESACCMRWNSFCYDKHNNLISKTNVKNAIEECGSYPPQSSINEILNSIISQNCTIQDWSASPCIASCAD